MMDSIWQVKDTPSAVTLNNSEQLGRVCRISYTFNPRQTRTVGMLYSALMPALAQGRFRTFCGEDGDVVAYVLWGTFAPDVSERVKLTKRFALHQSEWNEGDDLWLIDFACISNSHVLRVVKAVRKEFAKSFAQINYVRSRTAGASVRISRLSPTVLSDVVVDDMPRTRARVSNTSTEADRVLGYVFIVAAKCTFARDWRLSQFVHDAILAIAENCVRVYFGVDGDPVGFVVWDLQGDEAIRISRFVALPGHAKYILRQFLFVHSKRGVVSFVSPRTGKLRSFKRSVECSYDRDS